VLKIVILFAILALTVTLASNASAQEMKNATFSENMVVVYNHQLIRGDGAIKMVKQSGDIETSIGLQSTSNDDFKFSEQFIEKIKEGEFVHSIVFANMQEIDHKGDLVGCIPGVMGDSQCILINLDFKKIKEFITDEDRMESDGNVKRVQIETKRIGNSLINEINNSFDSNAKFHSVYIQSGDASEAGKVIEGTVSAVYTMPMQSSGELFKKFSNLLISNKITTGGGFYDIAQNMSDSSLHGYPLYEGQIIGPSITTPNISMTIFLNDDDPRYMLNVSKKYYNTVNSIVEINPLEYFYINELKRSNYFGNDFTPLNSLLDVLILTDEGQNIKIKSANANVIQKISTVSDITEKGWFFAKSHGTFIGGKYLFGQSNSVTNNELKLKLSSWDGVSPVNILSSELAEIGEERIVEDVVEEKEEEQSQYAILAIIIVAAIAAAIYYMKGYKSKH
tara:strand:+ start:1144 stop:2493 length:1350 start_codon:yes stop_codon:yes gene_type:complete